MARDEKHVLSLADFVSNAEQTVRDWTPADAEWYLQPWFRGHADASWTLQPSLYRMEKVSGLGAGYYTEAHLLDTFKLRARRYLDHEPRSDWEWLFEMQHHGLPTRLLDWTESYLVALYFAVRDADGNHDAAVWATNPWWINHEALGEYELFPADAPYALCWQPGIPINKLPENVLAIRPVYGSGRIQAQRGVFTIHGTNVAALDSLADMQRPDVCLRKFIIPAAAVHRIHLELTRAGITESVILPELAGLCRELKKFFFGA
jgi:hypothetical protein